jgi:putative hydrolases of HD superfamily
MKKQARNVLNFLKFSSQLKVQERAIKLSASRYESVADHSWHLALLALLIHPYLDNRVDILKALKMALIHDLVEARIGDVPYGHYAKNLKKKNEKKLKERKEMEKIKKMVGGKLGTEIYKIWHEFEKENSNEAKLVKALDSLEANHQSILFDVDYWGDDFYGVALTKAKKYCSHEKILFELDKEITARMEKVFKKAGLDVKKIKNQSLIKS